MVIEASMSIAHLEEFQSGHSSRAVEISILPSNSCGATCWKVILTHEHGTTTAYEVGFYEIHDQTDQAKAYFNDQKKLGIVFAYNPHFLNWPGLENTIKAALDAFEANIWIQ
jgi:hypothetical protein